MRITGPLILGAGPAGCAAAIALAQGGARPLLLDRSAEAGDALCGGFLSWRSAEQLAVLEEILRLEPVAGQIYRKATADITGPGGETIRAGERFAFDIRALNADEAVTGACPFAFDADRASREKITGAWLSFGDGPHRCPGAQVALHETRVFIDALLRVPGIRLEKPPAIGWCDIVGGYELHGAIVTCERG